MGTTYTYENYQLNPGDGVLTVAINYVDLGTGDEKDGQDIPDTFENVPDVKITGIVGNRLVYFDPDNLPTTSGFQVKLGTTGQLPPIGLNFTITDKDEPDSEVGAFYGNSASAASLAGVAVGSILDIQKTLINSMIDSKLKPDGFASNNADEYYDIEKDGQQELVLQNYPVIAVTSVIDDARSNTPTTLNSNNYVVDSGSGVLQLDFKDVDDPTNVGAFTKGVNTVRVQYSYGYASVPTPIEKLATLLLAKWLKIRDQQSNADGLRSVKAGDYSESFDLSFMNVKSEFDQFIDPLWKQCEALYKEWV